MSNTSNPSLEDMGFTLGDTVQDDVSGLTGVVIEMSEHISGCTQFAVQPPVDKDGKKIEGNFIDFQRLSKVKDGRGFIGNWPKVDFILGNEVQDEITGFKGIATSRYLGLNGNCIIHITPKHKDGEGYPKGHFFNAENVKKTGDGVVKVAEAPKKKAGGPPSPMRPESR